ncbi:mannose-ethanolamine phosphotransferase gpi13 [Gonapodya sp. JEL0774]|nr:mannose-ethanolamine phosphotransferase gpi13 [Gonapodya sp. JEL0774]
MSLKLSQWNSVLRNVTRSLPRDTLLLVMGDHGMTGTGDHGGDTSEETDVAFFAYSKAGLVGTTLSDTSAINAHSDAQGLDASILPLLTSSTPSTSPTPQLDLTPTLAYLLRLPIPSSSLGLPIPHLLWFTPRGTTVPPAIHLLHVTRAAVRATARYVERYTALDPAFIPQSTISSLAALLDDAEASFAAFSTAYATDTQSSLRDLYVATYLAYASYSRGVLTACRAAWASFDVPLMIAAVSVAMLGAVAGLGVVMAGISSQPARPSSPAQLGLTIKSSLGAFLVSRVLLRHILPSIALSQPQTSPYVSFLSSRSTTLHHLTIAVAVGCAIHVLTTYPIPFAIRFLRSGKASMRTIVSLPPTAALYVVPAIVQASSMVSDTFTIHEDTVVKWLLVGVLVAHVVETVRRGALGGKDVGGGGVVTAERVLRRDVLSTLAAAFTVLATSAVHTCRPEQLEIFPHCTSKALSTWSALAFAVVTAIATLALTVYTLGGTTTSRGIRGVAPLVLSFVTCILATTMATWALALVESSDPTYVVWGVPISDAKIGIVRYMWLPCGVAALASWWFWPVCAGVEVAESKAADVLGVAVPVKGRVRIVGMRDSTQAAYLLFVVTVGCALTVVQTPAAGAGLLGTLMTVVLLHIASMPVVPNTNGPLTTDLLPLHAPSAALQTALHLLALHALFATAHQTILSSFNWAAGFVGLRDVNYYISPVLVVLNAVGGPLLVALSAPLVTSWYPDNRTAASSPSSIRTTIASHTSLSFLPAAACMAGLVYLRRHLMVWSVFAPRWLFGVLFVAVADAGAVWAGVLWWRAEKGRREWKETVERPGVDVVESKNI